MFFFKRKRYCLLFFYIFLHKASLQATDPQKEHLFLPPLPQESFRTAENKSMSAASSAIWALLHAPQMDLSAILAATLEQEKSIQKWQKNKQKKLHQQFCSLGQAEKKNYYASLEQERKKQDLLWQRVHKHYKSSVIYYLKKEESQKRIDKALLDLLLKSFSNLAQMRSHRQKLYKRSWDRCFQAYRHVDSSQTNCLLPLACAEPSQEHFFQAYYLGLYRFLGLFPYKERLAFLRYFTSPGSKPARQ